ncbi:MAG TPA: EAL domain-containing protein [Solirubrobacteraceae bacterium]|nr:EAL domain-containing protein [Solirubrobacteraceae bacterium]
MHTCTSPAVARLRVHEGASCAAAHRYTGESQHFCTPSAGLQRRPWLARLHRALRDDRFELHYQPIECLATGEITHYEALVRLLDEDDGSLIAPGRFLPAAERHGLIGEIDRLVIRRVAALMGAGLAGGEARIAINLSARSATDPRMLEYIESELAHHGVAPERLIVEITETAAISDIDCAKRFCEQLELLGCAVALDDFGAGFGSFYYVKHLPFEYLKIDGDFIRNLTTSHEDQLVVRALVDVARGLGKRTVAEFVGDEDTMELLREYGVDYAQGYHVGHPAPLPLQLALAG